MAGSVAMEIQDLEVGYWSNGQKKSLLKSVNLQINRGEVVCLLGQNGVGKSSLLRTLAALQPPLSGKIILGSRSIESYSAQELAYQISLVLTEKVVAGNLSVPELVALGRHPYTNWLGILGSEDKTKVEEALSLTKINYLAEKKVVELSDGQYQKAMIARAVAQDGELMILDEPTAFLDLNNSVEIFLLLKQLAHVQQKAVVVSTHDFHLAMQFADKLWLTNFNSPLYEGLPEDLGLNGQLERSMFHEGFGLDLLSGRIVLPVEKKGEVTVSGSSAAHLWAKRALERNGWLISDKADALKIEVEAGENTAIFKLDKKAFNTIHELLRHLESMKFG